jgi:beta-1,4-mannosyl-glycoprotein beta-1,4-N-acetylglucosaminyltransferase
MKIYDSFLFFNELDLLEIRLELLYDKVDYFIISECDSSFSGLDKPFYFDENKHLFEKYMDKIIHIKNYNTKDINNLINTQTEPKKIEIFDQIIKYYNDIKYTELTEYGKLHWWRDFVHREFVKLGMSDCDDDDIIIFGDLDEIPNPNNLNLTGIEYVMQQNYMITYINIENISEVWFGGIVVKYKTLKNNSLNIIRNSRRNGNLLQISNCGWHLTSMGGVERVKTKIKSWGHQEYNNEYYLNNLEKNINNNTDIFERGFSIRKIDNISTFYPEKMLKLVNEKYKYLIK